MLSERLRKKHMRFTSDSVNTNVIRSFEPGTIRLRDTEVHSHLILSADTQIADWSPAPLAELSIADFEPALALQPEIILFGSGIKQQFPNIHLLTEIMRKGIAFEVMETHAACRTFNVLVGEKRAVVAALLVR